MTTESVVEIAVTLISAIFTVGVFWGVTKTQTHTLGEAIKDVRETVRHHVNSHHPKLEEDIKHVEVDLARISAVDKEERNRRDKNR